MSAQPQPANDFRDHLIRYGGDAYPEIVEKAAGCYVGDAKGKKILDFTSGQMCATVGHNHPNIVAAIRKSCDTALHLFSGMIPRAVVQLAEAIAKIVPKPLSKSLFVNTGSESNEAAIKMAKLATGGFEVVGLGGSWHGVTGNAGSVSFASDRKGYGPSMPGTFVLPEPNAYRCPVKHCRDKCDRTCMKVGFELYDMQSTGARAAVIAEPVISAGGVIVPPVGYFDALQAETRKRGMLLIAHANALDMQRIALDVGVDVLAHGLWNWGDSDGQPGVPAPIAEQLRQIHAKNIGYQATLRVLPGTADMFREDTLKDPMYAKVVPASVLAFYASPPGQWFKEIMRDGRGPSADTKIAHDWLKQNEQGMRALRYLYDLGHSLLVGSDTPSAPTYGSQPGYDTYREMRLMAQSGIPLDAIFRAATLNNAKQFGLARDYGTVETGKIANLLLLDANPLETMRAWSQIDKVMLHGDVIEREVLAADRK